MIHYKRTNSDDPDFLKLVAELDEDLRKRDGDEHVFYAQLNKTDGISTCLVAYQDGRAVGCGAIRELADGAVEVKRMYVLPSNRGTGIASGILKQLELWAAELGYGKCVLETGRRQTEALGLYQKAGYKVIPNFGKYRGVANSVCFEKLLKIME